MPGENSGKFDTSVDEGVRKGLRIDERHDRVDGVSRRDFRAAVENVGSRFEYNGAATLQYKCVLRIA